LVLFSSTLEPDDIIRSCGYMTAAGRWVYPRWQDAPSGQTYYPDYNLAPSKHRSVSPLGVTFP